MLKIGLTGGIGSGKSTISRMLKERNIPVIDADSVSREVIKNNLEIPKEIKLNFGSEFFDENNNLKRQEFGNYIFKNKTERKKYENIIMPYIIKEIFRSMGVCENLGESICVLDAPTLIENGVHKYMDINILVWLPKNIQIERVKERDKMNEINVLDRINSQMSLEEKKQYADFIIDNSGNIENTIKQLDKIFDSINIMRDCR
ncbi:dephospho-CoA kinase [Clostridium hydrogenum]|uniref:dephospho-CoA kinase n=1 Tax=Clostridium hydrogenum TaxID=2855764 RepID=UPI001EEBEDF4|nr:dephospho-CoA kinase [Clostridium hydrogenum]